MEHPQRHSSLLTTPDRLDFRSLRSGHRYNDLRNHIFSPDEKVWICEQIRILSEQKKLSVKLICMRYNIHPDGVKEWLQIYDSKESFVCSTRSEAISENPIDKCGLKRIKSWQISVTRCPVELRGIIEEELEASISRKRKSIIG